VLAALAIGAALGSRSRAGPPPLGGSRYALLLYEDASFQSPPPGNEARYVGEYRRWAELVRAGGNRLTGEERSFRGRIIEPSGSTTDQVRAGEAGSVLSGFFIVQAGGLDQATAIAKTCPHLKHGGRVVVRPIEPT